MFVKLTREVTFNHSLHGEEWKDAQERVLPAGTIIEAELNEYGSYRTQYGYLYRGEAEPVPA